MKRYLTIFLLIILFGVTAQAQEKMQTFSLKEEALQTSNHSFRIVEVADERKNKANIGWVQMSVFNVRHFADFERPLEEEIMDFLSRSQGPGSSETPVKLGVGHIYISEQTRAFSELALVELEVTFYARNEEKNWVPVWKAKSEKSIKKGADVTKLHPKNIATAMDEVLEILEQSNWRENLDYPLFTNPSDREVNLEEVPVYTAEEHPTGIFKTFEEFRDNRPGYQGKLKMRDARGMSIVLWEYDEKGKRRNTRKKDYYGFAYDNKLYINLDRTYCEIEKREDGLYFYGPSISDANATSIAQASAGLIGAVIASSATSHKVLYRIDLESGEFMELQAVE